MKKIRLLFTSALLCGLVTTGWGQTQIYLEDFEDATLNYTTSVAEFSDVSNDFFTRTGAGRTISGGYSVTSVQGSEYFAGQDLDGEGASLPLNLTTNSIIIANFTNLELRVYLAEDDDGSNQDWDAADYLHITYSIDGGADQDLLWVESSGGTNTEPSIDTDFDGSGDGTSITDAFVQFTESISGTGNTLTLDFEFDLNSGDEDIAIDHIEVYGTSSSGVANPTAFTATTNSASQIDLAYDDNAAGDNVVIVFDTDNMFTTPTNGNAPAAVGQPFAGGTVLFNGNGAGTFNHTSLTAGTQYFYSAWSVDGSNDYSGGLTDDATTLKAEPTNHATSFTATANGSSQIDLSWTDATGTDLPDNYLVKISTSSTITDPVDGTAEADDTDLSDNNGALNIAQGVESATFSGLTANTQYFFEIFPYANAGANIDFKVNGTIPTANATTAAAGVGLALPYTFDFESNSDGNPFNAGWIQVSVTGPTETWIYNDVANNADDGAQMNAFNGGCQANEDWLISPAINLNNTTNELLSIDLAESFSGTDLEVRYSTTYPGSGNPNVANWPLITTYATGSSGNITNNAGLQAVSGSNVYIAIRYLRNGSCSQWTVTDFSLTAPSVKPEPTNHVTSFTATANGSSQIDLSWTDNNGSVAADGFLIVGKTGSASFASPSDGTAISDDTDWSNDEFEGNVNPGVGSYSVTGLDPSTSYDFEIYPYTNSGSNIDYKTGGTVPSASTSTNALSTTPLPYSQDYTGQDGKGKDGTSAVDLSGVNWTVDVSNGSFTAASDFFAVKNGVFEGQDVDGSVTWTSQAINLNNTSNLEFSFDAKAATGEFESSDVFDVEFIIDGGTPITLFSASENASNLEFNGTQLTTTLSTFTTLIGSTGNTGEIRITVDNGAGAEFVGWDNLSVAVSTIKSEPTNHVTSFTATANGSSQIDLSWIDATGTDLPDNYLIKISTSSTITDPVDGTAEADDTDLLDNNGALNIAQGTQAATFTGLTPNTQYFFEIFPYANAGANIDYKVNGTIPTANATTGAAPVTPDLIITEVADPDDDFNGRFVEIYNYSNQAIDGTAEQIYFARQANGGNISSIAITQVINPGEVLVIGNSSNINTVYGSPADIDFGSVTGNGDDGYFLYSGGDENTGTLFDSYGVLGQNGSGQPWEYEDDRATRNNPQSANSNATWTAAEWTITASQNVADMTPGTLGSSFTFNGTWSPSSPDGTSTSLDEVTIESGSATFTSNTTVNNLTLEPTATLTISTSRTLTVNGTATLNADATGYAQVIGDVNGTVAVESYLTAGSARWFNVANPHAGGTVADFSLSDGSIITSATGTAGQVNIWYYDPATQDGTSKEGTWTRVPNTAESTDGKAFSLYLGPPHFGTFPITVTATSNSLASGSRNVSLDNSNGGWNFVPNPYPSALDWNGARGANSGNMNAAYHVDIGGSFASYNGSTSTNGGDQYIAPMQGFFVEATGNSTWALTRSHRSVGNNPNKLKSSATLLKLKASSMATQGSDESVVLFGSQYSDGFEPNLDGQKRMNYGPGIPNLFTTDSLGHQFVYNNLHHQFTEKVVPLSFENDTAGLHSIDISDNRLPADWSVTLVDKLNGNRFDLLSGSYQFAHNLSNRADRFELIFKQQVVGQDEVNTANIYAYLLNGKLAVNLENWNGQATVSVYDMQGRLMSTSDAEGGSTFRTDLSSLAQGLYLVKVTAGERPLYTQKIIK